MARRVVIATVRVVGFHHWPEAPSEVRYLAHPHRHLFTVRVEWIVEHADRALEFHLLQREILRVLTVRWCPIGDAFEFGSMSCEAIAEELAPLLEVRPRAIEVWEDDENGARVEFK